MKEQITQSNTKQTNDEYWYGKLKTLSEYSSCDKDNFVSEVDEPIFHIGQCYEDTAAKVLQCLHCGGRDFNVGQGNYFTAIRCKTCEWEVCIHDG